MKKIILNLLCVSICASASAFSSHAATTWSGVSTTWSVMSATWSVQVSQTSPIKSASDNSKPKTKSKFEKIKPAKSSKKAPIIPVIVSKYEERTFIATAYYSPLPDQKYYLRGNYEAEVILNGKWTHGASGKPVFKGMLAAPKGYDFRTKIWIEGFWIGSVEDRGWAIVHEGVRGNEFDRIDIWMWYGDEGLARALAWGRRTVKARIYESKDVATTFDYSKVPLAKLSSSVAKPAQAVQLAKSANLPSGITQVEKSTILPPKSTAVLASKTVDELDSKLEAFNRERVRVAKVLEKIGTPKIGDTSPEIRVLQEALIDLGHLKTKSTAVYGPATQSAIASFQKQSGIIVDEKDPNLGVFGKITRARLVEEILFRWVDI